LKVQAGAVAEPDHSFGAYLNTLARRPGWYFRVGAAFFATWALALDGYRAFIWILWGGLIAIELGVVYPLWRGRQQQE
jgi:hypothetical protein